ncbi:MAG: DUF2721 domain-containing protein [Planctomycetota bacterium]|nr:DUF2721 domain-containing protein [Planctomycetota bacterium]
MPDLIQVIQQVVAPVVMISACGLLCLALYNRLASVVTRLRGFNHERFLMLDRIDALSAEARSGPDGTRLRNRLGLLEKQVDGILRRARLLRSALICLIVGILCMLACSMAIGVALILPPAHFAAIFFFTVGLLSVFVGMLLALVELARSLDPVTLEQRSIPSADEAPDTRERIDQGEMSA